MKQLRKTEIKRLFKQYRKEKDIVLILENVEYARNVAGIFRTADAMGVNKIFLTGISQQPPFGKDLQKASRKKEQSVYWIGNKTTGEAIQALKKQEFTIIAVEITDTSIPSTEIKEKIEGVDKICLVLGSEVFGITKDTLAKCDMAMYIPMYGRGASLNVGTSAGIALYAIL